jgi:hypothetical protein
MFLIDDLLLLPIDGMKFVFRTLAKVAEEKYTDDAPVKEKLLELQVRLEEGKVTEEEYVQEEAAILRELREIENRKREMAGVAREDGVRAPFTGKVGEGSGVSVNLSYGQERKEK